MSAATETLVTPAATTTATRPFYWSVRRELWEHRSLLIAPLASAGVLLLAFCFAAYHAAQSPEGMAVPPERLHGMLLGIFSAISVFIGWTLAATAWFYCLDALHGERRDRSVLFWKSMPVSDTTTVLSKLFVVMAVVPVLAVAITLVTQFLVLLLGSVTALAVGHGAGPLWSSLQPFQQLVVLIYGALAASLWYAPISAWLLLVSSWAKRSIFLWSVLPPIIIVVFERVGLRSDHFADLLRYRLVSGLMTAFRMTPGQQPRMVDGEVHLGRHLPTNAIELLDPVGFLSNPHLWTGLVAAAVFIAGAVWMRRYREPI